ncbi:MAG: biotin--[acetyl-CoA-carboxylase] ligase [Treponema sp.]|nr:biotin--[acetyl-CoA-carboxylase] ligase [Treponema sp.]
MTTKEKVLQQLDAASGKSVSGQELAAICGISRAAIWKAVNALRTEGYDIEGTTNGGYILNDKDIFSTEIFTKTFSQNFQEFSECHIECFKEIDSTNTYAKRLLAECGNLRAPDGSLTQAGKKYHKSIIIAEKQTAGRGRIGRTFVSPEKSGIYFTLIYAPKGGIKEPAKLTACTAVAVCRAIKKLYDYEPKIKWINDIFANGKKICGIGTEGITNFESGQIESAIIGIGLNIHQNKNAFSQELAKTVGSLEEAMAAQNNEKSKALNRCLLAAEISGQVLKIFKEDEKSPENHFAIMEEYKKLSFLLGQEITVFPLIGDAASSYKAKATDIDQNAALIVTLADGTTKTLNSGEVTLKSANFN